MNELFITIAFIELIGFIIVMLNLPRLRRKWCEKFDNAVMNYDAEDCIQLRDESEKIIIKTRTQYIIRYLLILPLIGMVIYLVMNLFTTSVSAWMYFMIAYCGCMVAYTLWHNPRYYIQGTSRAVEELLKNYNSADKNRIHASYVPEKST